MKAIEYEDWNGTTRCSIEKAVSDSLTDGGIEERISQMADLLGRLVQTLSRAGLMTDAQVMELVTSHAYADNGARLVEIPE